MRKETEGWSLDAKARIAGIFYLLTILFGALAAVSKSGSTYESIANLLATAAYLVVTLLFYSLFKPVNAIVSWIASLFSLAGCAISTLGAFHVRTIPIDPLGFFGAYCLLLGFLIFRSTFLPRFLGVLMAFAGCGWLTFAFPSFSIHLTPFNALPGLVGEGALTLWLLAAGVKEQRGNEPAGPKPAAHS